MTSAPGAEKLRGTIANLWEEMKGSVLARVAVVEGAVAALRCGSLEEGQRAEAEREAHKLAGSAGMFGFTAGSKLAREAELTLGHSPLSAEDLGRLSAIVAALRSELGQAPADDLPKITTPANSCTILVVGVDAGLGRRLAVEANSRGLAMETVPDPERAVQMVGERSPAAAIVNIGTVATRGKGLATLERMRDADPSVPLIVISPGDGFVDRLDVARRGGRGFLSHPADPGQVFDAVSRSLTAARSDDMKVLALDDDAVVLAGLRPVLEDAGFRLTTLADPTQLWERLHEVNPDLLVLDFDMPEANGMELCRVVRNDPRWAELPVVFLTACADPGSVEQMFAAGADDFVSKPVVGPELAARISNRLERVRLYRHLANTDPLTGLHNRRKSEEAITRLLTMARRYKQPLSLAVVDLDHFKQVNDRYGHAAGDSVLRGVANILREAFRGEDVVARWGGEEFVVALYGASKEHAVHRLTEVMESLRGEDLLGETPLAITFSAGVTQFPGGGEDVQALYRTADAALYRAKKAGRARVLPST